MTIKYDKATNGVTIYKKPKVKTVNGKRMKFYGSIDFGRPILPQPKEPKRKTLRTSGLKTCSICKFPFTGFGNNPQPVKDLKVSDSCCDECNDTVVIPLRFRTLGRELN